MKSRILQPNYLSYLLRLRRVDNAGRSVWRASLEAPGSENQIYFDNLEALYAYLVRQIQQLDDVPVTKQNFWLSLQYLLEELPVDKHYRKSSSRQLTLGHDTRYIYLN